MRINFKKKNYVFFSKSGVETSISYDSNIIIDVI